MIFGIGSHTIDQTLILSGPPFTVTGFYRSFRGIENAVDDALTNILQYGGEKKNLVVTVKISMVTLMQYRLKYFIRGYKGTFVKFRDDEQESQVMKGLGMESHGFGVELEATWGLLTMKEKVDAFQTVDEGSGR